MWSARANCAKWDAWSGCRRRCWGPDRRRGRRDRQRDGRRRKDAPQNPRRRSADYEVTEGDRLLHAGSIPDLGVVRSFAYADGTLEQQTHHTYELPTYEFNV